MGGPTRGWRSTTIRANYQRSLCEDIDFGTGFPGVVAMQSNGEDWNESKTGLTGRGVSRISANFLDLAQKIEGFLEKSVGMYICVDRA